MPQVLASFSAEDGVISQLFRSANRSCRNDSSSNQVVVRSLDGGCDSFELVSNDPSTFDSKTVVTTEEEHRK